MARPVYIQVKVSEAERERFKELAARYRMPVGDLGRYAMLELEEHLPDLTYTPLGKQILPNEDNS